MRKYYGRKSWVPRSCPRCGNGVIDGPFPGLLELFSAYRIGLGRDPKWGIPRWYGECPKCEIAAKLFDSPSIWDTLNSKSYI